jgi:hypothetical protein
MTDVRRNLKIKEVYLVGKPANPKAKVALFKAEDESGVAKDDKDQTLADRLSRGFAALAKIITGDETVVDLSKLNAKLQDRAKALPEATQKAIATLPESELEKEDGSALVLIEVGEAFAKSDADLKEAQEDLAKVKKAVHPGSHDDDEEKKRKAAEAKAAAKKAELDKSELPEAAQNLIKDLEKTAVTQADELKKSQDRIAKLEEDNLTARLTARLEKLDQVIPPDERDDEIKMLKGLSNDAREHWFKRLEKDNAALKESAAFKVLGSDSAAVTGDAWAQITKRAEELVTKSTDGLTQEQAIDKVLVANPDLYTAYKAERAQTLN